jgi:hypothetical protein
MATRYLSNYLFVILLLPLPLAIGHTSRSHSLRLQEIQRKYDSIELQSINTVQWKTYTNDDGSIAWNTSYVLNSYIDMYEVTTDRKYLDKFTALADPIPGETDDRRDLVDYKGRRRVGWGSVAYSMKKQRIVWLAHTGMITYPLVRFAYIVNKHRTLSRFRENATKYQLVSEAALKEFDDQWRYDAKSGEGFYVFESDQPLENGMMAGRDLSLPFNMQLAAGRAFIVLWKLTGKDSYYSKAEALARHFKDHLHVDSFGGYSWTYWFGKGLIRSAGVEDVSHGAIDVDFAVLAAQNGIVFDTHDLEQFIRTFFHYYKRDWTLAEGLPLASKQDPYALARWLNLCDTQCSVCDAVSDDLLGARAPYNSLHLIALSALAKYSKKCS